jgi:hypothetical protein
MTIQIRTAAMPARILNTPSSSARGRIRSTGHPLHAVDPIERAWARNEAALPFGYRQPTTHWTDISRDPEPMWDTDPAIHANHVHRSMSRKGECLYPRCQRAVIAIGNTQQMPSDPEKELRPYTTFDGRAGEPPSEFVTGKRAGVTVLSFDIPTDEVADIEAPVKTEGPNPYIVEDPETRSQIDWEREARYSGPITHWRRKWDAKRQRDIVVVDRWGGQGQARCWYEPLGDDVAFVFETQRPLDYKAQATAYVSRVIALTGSFPTWSDQEAMREAGAIDRLERKAWPVQPTIEQRPDLDPYRFRFVDEEMEGPYEVIDVSPLMDMESIARYYRRPSPDDLLPEEIAEIEDRILANMKANNSRHLIRYTTRQLRGHENWTEATEALLHSNGAEYLASTEDAVEGFTTDGMFIPHWS